ncbi:efflux RND transporter permease subunit [Virgibacillus sediminis]|uniref:Efflux RND transporter permease subunit n=1 Tax=Virgibacillus sediminis TaxID=202260 RepID=A0ABV7A7R7_9BACI
MKIVNTSVKRPVGVIMIVLAIIALGLVSVRSLTIDLFPKIDLPVAVVATSYQEAAPEDVDNLISQPIESAVSSIEGIDTIQSQSQAGNSLVLIMFQNGTDIDQALLDIRESIDRIKAMLPDQAGDPSILRFSPDQMPVMWVGLTGQEASALTEKADDDIVPYLERQPGVASVTVEGGKEREVQVVLDEAAMQQYGVTAQAVSDSLSGSNMSASVGTVEKGDQDLQLRLTGEFESLEDIEQTFVQTETGATVKVEDIAEVNDTYKETTDMTLVNGEPAVVLSVLKQTDANTVEIAGNVNDGIADLREELPESMGLEVVIDTSEYIQMSIDSVLLNIIIGGIISAFVLLLFLKSIRATLVIGISIPIAIISAFALLYFTGQTLNILTLGGLALGLGMMVDSSIVILEHIYSYRKRGYSLFDSATKGASELAPAVIASTTTTLVVFLPIIYVEGIASDMFTPLALAVSFSLIASLVVAITLVPMLSSKLLAKAMEDNGRRYWFDRFLGWLADRYQGGLEWVLGHRKTSVTLTILALVGSIALTPLIGAEFIPSSDQGQLQITAETAPGSTLEETEEVVGEVNKRLDEYADTIETSYVLAGGDPMTGSGPNTATYTMQLVPAAEREVTTSDFVVELDEALAGIPGADITVSAMDSMEMGDPLQIQVSGPEHEVLRDISADIVEEISQVDGVFNPNSGASDAVPQMAINVDNSRAAMYGLNQQQILGQIQMRFTGQVVTQYREAGQEMDVSLIYPEDARETIKDVENMQVQAPTGAAVPLSEVADLDQENGPVTLTRENQQPQINISSEVEGRDLGSVVEDVETTLDGMTFPEGYDYSIGGQAQDMSESFTDLAIALVFSIFLVYAVMAIQFENFLFPFIIMFALPTTVIGVILGFLVTGLPLSIVAFIGIIMLAGIVVNNSIVLVDYINILRRNGMDRREAITEAGRSRLRPILMTTLTTILAMVPLAIGIGEGAELQQPLAVTLIFGLGVSSLFTIFFVPVVYTLFDDLTRKVIRRKKKEA